MSQPQSPCADHPYPPYDDPSGRCTECVEAENGGGEYESTNVDDVPEQDSGIAAGDGAGHAGTEDHEVKDLSRAERRAQRKPRILISRPLTEEEFDFWLGKLGLSIPFPNIVGRWGRPIEEGSQMGAENPGGFTWVMVKEVGITKDRYLYAFIGPRRPLAMRPRRLKGLWIMEPESLRADYAARDPRIQLSFMEWCAFCTPAVDD